MSGTFQVRACKQWVRRFLCCFALALFLAGCSRTDDGLSALAGSAAVGGLWDEDGTAAGYQKAIQHYEAVLQTNPSDLTALTEISYSYTKLGWLQRFSIQYDLRKWTNHTIEKQQVDSNLNHAWEFLRRAKEIDPQKDIVLAAESILQKTSGHLPEAISLATQAFHPKPSSPRILEAYEVTQSAPDQIRELYKQALTLAPRNAYYWWRLGVYEKSDKAKQAAFERAISLSPAFVIPRVDFDLTKWGWPRLQDLNQLMASGNAPSSYVSYYKRLTILDTLGGVWIAIFYVIAIRARTRVLWVFLMLYPCMRLVFSLLPGLGDKYVLIEKSGEALSETIYFLGGVVCWDLLRAWFRPDSSDSFHSLVRSLSRGMLAAWRKLFRIPIEQSRADWTYVLLLGELWALHYATQQIFLRLVRW